jgi:N6-adenosine-specific RNA methylase IME4
VVLPDLSIPETVEELAGTLDGMVGMISMGGWWTAAAVYAWTEPGAGGPRTGRDSAQLSMRQFAELGIRGFHHPEQVRAFRAAWTRAIGRGWAKPVMPGDHVRLPDQDFILNEPPERPALTAGPLILPPGRYTVLLADPPWRYHSAPSPNRKVENHYPTLPDEEIAGYQDADGRPVTDLAADDAVLYLWATIPKLESALAVLHAWGFTYKSGGVWVKDRIGMGYWWRQRAELLLTGTRGEPAPPPPNLRPDGVIEAPRREHSRKPDEVYEFIDAIWPGPVKVELFGRATRPGWAVYGNQVAP